MGTLNSGGGKRLFSTTPRPAPGRTKQPGRKVYRSPPSGYRYNSAPPMCLPGLDKNNFVFTFVFVALGRRSLQLFLLTVGSLDWRSDGVLCCACIDCIDCIDSSSPLRMYVYFRQVFKIEFSAVLGANVFRNVKLDSFWMNTYLVTFWNVSTTTKKPSINGENFVLPWRA